MAGWEVLVRFGIRVWDDGDWRDDEEFQEIPFEFARKASFRS